MANTRGALPADDGRRRAADIALYGVGGAAETLNRLTRLATKALRAPVSLVCFLDEHRQSVAHCIGLPEAWASDWNNSAGHSLCYAAVAAGRALIIPEARGHVILKDDPAVTVLGVAAYAGVPLVSPEGQVVGAMCAIDTKPREWTPDDVDLLTDLAAAVMTEVSLGRAKAAAEAANRAKDRFLAVLSHELRTPVTPAMMIAASLSGDESLPPEAREDGRTILRNLELQTRLIDDLLDVTRIENGKLSLRLGPLDLHGVLKDCVGIFAVEASAKGVRLSLRPDARNHGVRGDGHRLRQVFCNLVKNAVKFTPAQGSVIVRTIDAGVTRVRVEVRDTGIGIDAAVLPTVFKPFEQGERAITNESSGLGLGLAISRGIVVAHGGTIAAASDGPGRGTTVVVELPATPSVPPATDDTPTSGHAPNAVAMPGLSILVVDDHHDTLNAMSRLLRKLDHRVTTADSKAAALGAATRQEFDLLISDIGLPDGTGFDLMRELLARRPLKGIALTGYGSESDIERTREAGFSAHLTKPINLAGLQAVIDQVRR
jgi:signal transduction histidine kinase/CheY-like chemotaxis protein